MTAARDRTSSFTPAANEGRLPGDDELSWLMRRKDLLSRAIAEMEQPALAARLSRDLMPDVPELLAWAHAELRRVDLAIERLGSAT